MKQLFRKSLLSLNKLLLLFSFSIGYNLHGQSISPMPPGFSSQVKDLAYDTLTQSLYACGNFTYLFDGTQVAPMNYISKWNGSNWDSLGSGADGPIYRIVIYNSQIIAGGYFLNIGGVQANGLARWDGTSWSIIGNPTKNGVPSYIKSLYVDGNDLYVGGSFDSIGGILATGIARFDGTTWNNLPNFTSTTYDIGTIIKFNNSIYVGGDFDEGNGLKDLMHLDGNNWVSVGGGFSGFNTHINCMNIYQNKLIVGGYFRTQWGDPSDNIAVWDGNNWSQLDVGVMPSNVIRIFVNDGKLYAMGAILEASGLPVSFVAVWNGSNWTNFDNINFNLPVAVMEINDSINKIYIGGAFYTINGDTIRYIAQYDLSTGMINPIGDCFNLIQHTNLIRLNSVNCGIISNYSLTDITGRLLYKNKNNRNSYFEINMANFLTGVYILSFEIDRKQYSRKIFIH